MLGGFGKLTSLDVRDSTAFLAPFFAHKTQPLGTGYALGTLASARRALGFRVVRVTLQFVCACRRGLSCCVKGSTHVLLMAAVAVVVIYRLWRGHWPRDAQPADAAV